MTPDEPVATGDRHDEAHYEPDPEQLVSARFLVKPTTPMPPDMATGRPAADEPVEPGPPIEDVAVAPDTPSVWDARPVASEPQAASPAAGEPVLPTPQDIP
ncbi:MAG TPA: hypothetical protein VIE16_13000 [Phenylobacterium sp.]|jgi:hypothetical protein